MEKVPLFFGGRRKGNPKFCQNFMHQNLSCRSKLFKILCKILVESYHLVPHQNLFYKLRANLDQNSKLRKMYNLHIFNVIASQNLSTLLQVLINVPLSTKTFSNNFHCLLQFSKSVSSQTPQRASVISIFCFSQFNCTTRTIITQCVRDNIPGETPPSYMFGFKHILCLCHLSVNLPLFPFNPKTSCPIYRTPSTSYGHWTPSLPFLYVC